MKIFGMGPVEFIIILAVIFLVFFVFGPKNLPKMGTAFGKALKNFREGMGSAKKAAKKEESKTAEEPAQAAELVEVIDKPAPGRASEQETKEKAE
ncbi:MAG: twin-arginine translocase TatA/TatE family subunit [Coriobacteriia bacterium]|nr:twin-arginine translocase TatA/TatE family subunit [Coriobacteriia bacterium]